MDGNENGPGGQITVHNQQTTSPVVVDRIDGERRLNLIGKRQAVNSSSDRTACSQAARIQRGPTGERTLARQYNWGITLETGVNLIPILAQKRTARTETARIY